MRIVYEIMGLKFFLLVYFKISIIPFIENDRRSGSWGLHEMKIVFVLVVVSFVMF